MSGISLAYPQAHKNIFMVQNAIACWILLIGFLWIDFSYQLQYSDVIFVQLYKKLGPKILKPQF